MPSGSGGAGTQYASSFNYAPGAVFNTIESYNGRAFGGLGQVPGIPQQQASDFIQAGGTFAIGNVWEPFALTLADNRPIVLNFLLGSQTWGRGRVFGDSLPVVAARGHRGSARQAAAHARRSQR